MVAICLLIRTSGQTAQQCNSAPNMRVAVLALLTSPVHPANNIGNFQYAGIGVGRSGSAYIITIDLAR